MNEELKKWEAENINIDEIKSPCCNSSWSAIGRANYRCDKCKSDISLQILLIYEALMEPSSTVNVYFYTEFTGFHHETTLISIGLVSDLGKTFYAELDDYDPNQVDEYLKEDVISKLKFTKNYLKIEKGSVEMRGNTEQVKAQLTKWLEAHPNVEMWSDCLAYSWVLFNRLFGKAFDVPENVLYIPFDLSTLLRLKGINPDISRERFSGLDLNAAEHNALWDAKAIQACYAKAMKYK